MYLMLQRKASTYSLHELLNVKLAYMPSCICPEVRLPFVQKVFCVSYCCEKLHYASASCLLAFCSLLYRSKIPLVLTNKVTHLHSLLFRQQDGISVVRRVYLTIKIPPQIKNKLCLALFLAEYKKYVLLSY